MSETISSGALTTLQRVKDRIMDTNTGQSQPSSFDTVLIRMINSCSQWFKRECLDRDFIFQLYSNDVYSAYNSRQKKLLSRQAPIFFKTTTGNFVSGSNQITGVSSTAGMVVGMPVASDNIIATTILNSNQVRNYITAISGSTVTLAAAASATATAGVFQVNGLINIQWRAGTPATQPGWMNFIADQFELIENGKAGSIRLYGFFPNMRDNMIRMTYYAGYLINWSNTGDEDTHTLPADISNTVENLVVRVFKRRMLAGKGSEGLDAATTSWNKEIDDEDQAVIGHYRRMPRSF